MVIQRSRAGRQVRDSRGRCLATPEDCWSAGWIDGPCRKERVKMMKRDGDGAGSILCVRHLRHQVDRMRWL